MKKHLFSLPFLILFCCSYLTANNYFYYICHQKRPFIYFSVPKTGFSTFTKIFETNGKKVELYYGPIDPKFNSSYFKFAFVRNPWDRVVSAYENKVVFKDPNVPQFHHLPADFETFINFIENSDLHAADLHIRLQVELIPHDVDFIGRFENFEEDAQKVLKKIGMRKQEIPHCNKTEHLHYSRYYNERTKAIIERKYQEDIKAFGYQFDIK